MKKDSFIIRGIPTIELYDQFGNLKQSLTQDNLIVDVGKNFIIQKAFDQLENGPDLINTIAAGSGTTAAAGSDTALENKLGETLVSSYSVNNNEVTLFATIGENVATGTINELGILTDADLLVSRIVVSTPFEKTSTDYLNVSWKIQIG